MSETAAKPLLRGWLHPFAAVAALIITILLATRTFHDPARLLSMLVFGIGMVLLYVVSSTYHIGHWTPRVSRTLRAFDHSNIYVLIAATYTPLAVNVLSGGMRTFVLALVWSAAAAGISTCWTPLRLPRWLSTASYIAMGWIVLIPLPRLVELLPRSATFTLFLGGLFYTLGGVIYALKRPDPFPGVFGFHEIFHLLVVAGSVTFAVAMWVWVAPYPHN